MSTLHATTNDALQQLVACSRELYTLPRVAMQVLELTEQERVDIPALRNCLEHDPALTSKVLRVVNSSLFGLPRQVADLNHALTLLGVKPLKMLVLGFSLPPNLTQGIESEVLQQYWRRTMVKAVASRELARRWGSVDAEELLIAGLLQDIGVLVLLQQLGEPYCRFVKQAWQAGNQLTSLERTLFGFDHAEITARLLNVWQLPKPLIAAMRVPEDLAAHSPQANTILWLAELVTSFLCSGDPELLAALYQSLATWKQVPQESVELFLIELQVHVEQFAAVYLQQADQTEDHADLITQARRQMAQQSPDLCQTTSMKTRDMSLDQEQWHELIELLENMAAEPALLKSPPASATDQVDPVLKSPRLPELPRELATPAMLSVGSVSLSTESLECDPVLLRRVSQCASHCRAHRQGLSLLLVELDRADQTLLTQGVSYVTQLREDCEDMLNQWLHTTTTALPLGDSGFAMLLEDTERLAACRLGRRLLDAISRSAPLGLHYCATTLSMGVASICLPPKNFQPQNLVAAAGQCLRGAKLSGGACLKSLEIY